MNVNYEYYKLFYYVAKYKSFTKAAKALGNSQPNITRAMNSLEQELQATLFIRTNRGVQLTPEGERLNEHVTAAMVQLHAAESELAASTALEGGSITIGASETALNIYLLDKLKTFHMAHPGIRLRICNHSTPQAIRSVKSGEIDFAVVSTPTTATEPLREVRLETFREILIGGRTFATLADRQLTLEDVQARPFICLGRETMTYQFYHELFLQHGLELEPDTEAATTDQILPLVKSELGLAFIPEPLAREALRRREIVQLQLKETVPARYICLVYDPQRPLNAAARKLRHIIAGKE